jgi:hypothetical protein
LLSIAGKDIGEDIETGTYYNYAIKNYGAPIQNHKMIKISRQESLLEMQSRQLNGLNRWWGKRKIQYRKKYGSKF